MAEDLDLASNCLLVWYSETEKGGQLLSPRRSVFFYRNEISSARAFRARARMLVYFKYLVRVPGAAVSKSMNGVTRLI